MVQNKAFMYRSIPDGWPKSGQDLVVESTDFDLDAAPPEGGFISKNLYATFDPAQRGLMRDPSKKSYVPAFELNKPLPAFGLIAKVLKSDAENFKAGDIVLIFSTPTEEYTAVPQEKLSSVQPIKPADGVPLTAYVSALGLTGLTAYGSLMEIGQPQKGETLLVSAAAGAVGMAVGQIALHKGLKVIGSVGDDKKLEFITKELGFTSGFNYKKEKPADALSRLAPEGLDIYYDNVGGEVLDEALSRMNDYGRIIASGTISTYNTELKDQYGIKNYTQINIRRLKYQGFIVLDPIIARYAEQRDEDITKWIKEGSFKSVEHIIDGGIDEAFDAYMTVFRGDNIGRTLLKIADP